jgi:hypothetical protein
MKLRPQNPSSSLLVCLATCLLVPQVSANCLLPHDTHQHSHWHWHVTTDVQFANLSSSDTYFSGTVNDIWRAEHDLDGELYGMTITGSPPFLGNMISGFIAYRGGDLDGDFSTRGILPVPDGPYPGSVSFDRDEFELGVDVKILNAVYARLAYYSYKMEGDWTYPGGGIEPQEYDFEALELGVGFRQDYESCYSPKLTFGVDAYLAAQFVNYEHTEVLSGLSAETDGVGFKGRIEANTKYLIMDHTRVVLAGGYAYQDFDDDDLGLTNDGFFIRLGLEMQF